MPVPLVKRYRVSVVIEGEITSPDCFAAMETLRPLEDFLRPDGFRLRVSRVSELRAPEDGK